MPRALSLVILTALILGLVPGPIAPAQAASRWQQKVDEVVLQQAAQGESEFLIVMNAQADLSAAAALPDKIAKGRYVYETLARFAETSQAGILHSLQASGAHARSYWIANLIWVRGDLPVVQAMAGRSDVYRIIANPWVRGDLGELASPEDRAAMSTALTEWNLDLVGAPQVWGSGYTGAGVVIGGQDTGYQWDHPALINSYRGWDGSTAAHAYNWHDAIHDEITLTPNPCGLDAIAPCDDHGHGTHTMGIMTGDDGAGNQVGMAPGARWIGCRNMESGYGKPSTYIECYQWFLAPTDLKNTNPNPDLAPHVINNSWSCPVYEGCTDPWVMETVVNNLAAAGILSVHSAGNSGPNCSTVNEPAATYASSFTVGNTTSSDSLAASSSRGPVLVDSSGRRKPDISAPGTNIRSSYPGGGYANLSGTSMAAPHVAGLAALLISANPGLGGQPAFLREIMELTAYPNVSLPAEQICGGISSTTLPNNQFGWGRINAQKAAELARSLLDGLQPDVQAPVVPPGAQAQVNLTIENRMPIGSGLDFNATFLQAAIPPDTVFITATLPHIRQGDLITWTRNSLPASSAFSTTLILAAPNVLYAEIPVAAQAWSGAFQPAPASAPLIVTALQASLSGPTLSASGLPLTYTLTISNAHTSEVLAGLLASAILPPGAAVVSASLPYTQTVEMISWSQDSLNPGQDWMLTFTLMPTADDWRSDPAFVQRIGVQAANVGRPTSRILKTFLLAPSPFWLPVLNR